MSAHAETLLEFLADPVSSDWPARKTAIGGPDVAGAYPFNFFGDVPYRNVTLDDVLDMGRIGGNVTINRVMDTEASALCYTYDIFV